MKSLFSIFFLGIVFFSPHPLFGNPSPSASNTESQTIVESIPLSTPSPAPLVSVTPTPLPSEKKASMKPASKLITKQQKGIVYPDVLSKATNTASAPVLSILVSLSKQRAYLKVGEEIAIDSPISSGKKTRETPKGEYVVLEKDPDHHSNLYGDFVNDQGKIIRSGVSSSSDVAPSGTHFRGASMKYFLRLTPEGVGMHVGILPGYPASHGCIRMPLEMIKLIYQTVSVKTPVSVRD